MNRVDLRDFLSAYLAEVDEQLHAANGKLLEIDAALQRGEAHPRAVRDLFRALHTIKGLSAMVNVEPAVTISHRLEALVRAADRSGGRVAAPAVDAILQGVHAIESRVRELAEGKVVSAPPPALIELLDALELAPAEKAVAAAELDLDPALAAKLAPFERDALAKAPREAKRALRVDFSPAPAKAERGFTINSVRERIGAIAEIVKVLPIAVAASDEAPGGLTFALLLVTSAPDAEIARAADVAEEDVRRLHATTAEAATASLPPLEEEEDEAPQRRGVVRVDVARLDDAMEHLSALVVTRSRLARAIAKLAADGSDTRELAEIMRENGRQLRELRASILRVRMVPMAEVLERIPLIVRGLRRDSGKQVRLEIDAGSAELDKGVAERLFPAIVHLVRNAVDHAIEPPEVRRARGKPEEALLRLACHSTSNTRLELSISDDGGGVDRDAVARRLGREIAPGDAALLDALCTAGLSTRERATTTSGRGMGMDIVRRVVDQLGGDLALSTTPGQGTTFTVHVPLTISIVDAFTLDCRRERFVVPVSMVDEIVPVEPERIRVGPLAGGRGRAALLERRGEAVPLVELSAALAMPIDERRSALALVVRRGGMPLAFGLDRVLGQQEAVVRPLVDPLVQVTGLSGATDLGDGKPTLVLDLVALGARLLAEGAAAA